VGVALRGVGATTPTSRRLRSVLYIVDGSTPFLDPDALDGKNTTPAMRGAIQPELMSVSKASGP
jgi:hypothetical protein